MRIVVAEDHAIVRTGLVLQLRAAMPEADITEAASFDTVIEQVRNSDEEIGLIVADLTMPGMDWRKGLTTLRTDWPDVPVLVLSGHDDPTSILEVLTLGARGFIPKTESTMVMTHALRLVLAGGTYIPPSIIDAMDPGSAAFSSAVHRPLLSPRQKEVLRLINNGRSNKQIAYELNLAEGTVKLHVAAILKALGATNRTEAVSLARDRGLLG